MEMTILEFILNCLCWFLCGISVKGCIDEYRKCNTKEKTIEGWVARNESGTLYLYFTKPHRAPNRPWWVPEDGQECIEVEQSSFPEVTWKSEPKKVSVTIKSE